MGPGFFKASIWRTIVLSVSRVTALHPPAPRVAFGPKSEVRAGSLQIAHEAPGGRPGAEELWKVN